MNINNALAGVAVSDIAAAIVWYENLIGRPPDIRPMEHVAAWQFREGGWVEIFADAARAGKSTVIFSVISLESQVEDLAEKSIVVSHVTPAPNIGEVGIVFDPDGNQIVFAGPLTGVLDD